MNGFAQGVGTRLAAAMLAVAAFTTVVGAPPWGLAAEPLLTIHHAPESYGRRAGELTANLTGALSPDVAAAAWRVNQGDWRALGVGGPRAPAPSFVIEIPAAALRPGGNQIDVVAHGPDETRNVFRHDFAYDPAPPALPLVRRWDAGPLDVQDGRWQRVRQAPGSEDYDRLLLVTGAFAGGRRVVTDLVLRDIGGGGPFGFGVIALWGGHPESEDARPRRGWRYGLGWYYSRRRGVGVEVSVRAGDGEPLSVGDYRDATIVRGARYRVVIEAWPVAGADGGAAGHRLRMRWWADGATPGPWIVVLDDAALPAGEYAVALLAHRAQVDFGPVRVEALPAGYAPAD